MCCRVLASLLALNHIQHWYAFSQGRPNGRHSADNDTLLPNSVAVGVMNVSLTTLSSSEDPLSRIRRKARRRVKSQDSKQTRISHPYLRRHPSFSSARSPATKKERMKALSQSNSDYRVKLLQSKTSQNKRHKDCGWQLSEVQNTKREFDLVLVAEKHSRIFVYVLKK